MRDGGHIQIADKDYVKYTRTLIGRQVSIVVSHIFKKYLVKEGLKYTADKDRTGKSEDR